MATMAEEADNIPLALFVGPSGDDINDGNSRDSPFRTLAKAVQQAVQRGAAQKGGSITLLEGHYIWEEDDGLVDGLIGPSAANPFEIKADTAAEGRANVLLDGSNMLPPLSQWDMEQEGIFCTLPGFHPMKEVKELWFTGLGRRSVTGGEAILGVRAQHPNVMGGDRDSADAWPLPSTPEGRDTPLEGSVWDKSARLGNNDGGPTLGLLDADATVLSPPPKCFLPQAYDLAGNRCTNGCQQITGQNVAPVSEVCPFGLPDCPERYHDAFIPHPDPKDTDNDMNDCPAAFQTCDRQDKDSTWPWCLDLHNIGYVSDATGASSGLDYSAHGGGELYVTACVDKKLLGPFPIIAHDTSQGKIYFNYTSLSVNVNAPAKQTPLWEGMTSCWKMDADKIEDITGGSIKTDYFRMEVQPKYKVVARAAFDSDLEWWHDGIGQKLCVQVDEPLSSAVGVRVKQRGSMIRLLGSEYVSVVGLTLFATEMHAESRGAIGFSNHFRDMVVEYPDEIRLIPAGLTNSILRYGKGTLKLTGAVTGSNRKPERCTFINNMIEYAEKGVELTNCAGADIKHNTIHHIYNGDAFEIYQHGCDCDGCWDATECIFEVSYNRIHDVGFNGHCDCSGIQTKFGAVKDMRIHHNWIYSLPYHKGIRLDTGENGAYVYENMIWSAAKGGMFKGGTVEGHQIIQNTAFGSHDVDLSVLEYELGSGSTTPWKPYNTKSIVYNNAADDWRDSGNRKCTEKTCVSSPGYALKAPKLNQPWKDRWEKCEKGSLIPCNANWDDLSPWLEEFRDKTGEWKPTGVSITDNGCQSGQVGQFNTLSYGTCKEDGADWHITGSWPAVRFMLRNVGNFDFRPGKSATKTLTAQGKAGVHFESNDIGAYQTNAPHYNIPGQVESAVSFPVPPNGAFNVQTDADLMFLRGFDTTRHVVLLETSFCAAAMSDPGSGQVELIWPRNVFVVDGLEAGSRYYWRVDSFQQDGAIVKGSVWCFDVETAESSNQRLSTPWNQRTNLSECTLMDVDKHCSGVPTSSPTQITDGPNTVVPTLSSSSVCQDDVGFRYQSDPIKSCIWVAEHPGRRCEKGDVYDEKTVAEACPVTCETCCEDVMSFRYQSDPMKSCLWAAEKPGKRCAKSSAEDEKTVAEACPTTCGLC
eukprot:CAMPEP_0113526642 /NCGR_PEP_ID=MMETSP0015_2-20120614/859_1 /TAXON_ID=2838 /ORGANISM="Odontella" /LENGTH=1144 /DNA_ID=CAMNT_0000424999 /DNA_START=702 /DNA_END=4136 /DNA_ORIENTATION=- /assembly_acc=CAM_ASM_000160